MEEENEFAIAKVPQIESWFKIEDSELKKRQKEMRENMYPFKFFDKYKLIVRDIDFWSYLTLMEVINLALAIKEAAYGAYNDNVKGFNDFCRMAWNERRMDLTELKDLTIKSILTLKRAFGTFEVDEILFPMDVPEEILDHLPYARTFTFNLTAHKIYKIPKYAIIRTVNLTINCCFSVAMNDSLNAILFAFPHTSVLTNNNAYFTEVSMAALGVIGLKKLVVTRSSLALGRERIFVRALMNSKDSLESITIDAENNYIWERTLHAFSIKIREFRRLKECIITTNISRHNIWIIRALTAARSLARVHVITICHYNIQSSEKMEEIAKRALAKKNVSLTIEKRMMVHMRRCMLYGDDWI